MEKEKLQIVAFTDGACKGNPGPGGWGIVLLLTDGEVRELGGFDKHTTNNKMELTAVIQALAKTEDQKEHLLILSDSKYVIDGLNNWLPKWQRNQWITSQGSPVANRDLWEELSQLVNKRKLHGGGVSLKYVPAHSGIDGNERADQIASGMGKGETLNFYIGRRDTYPHDLSIIEAVAAAAKNKNKPKVALSTHWYVSYVDDVFRIHTTWPDCEALVKSKAFAKYRKVETKEQEETLRRKWSSH